MRKIIVASLFILIAIYMTFNYPLNDHKVSQIITIGEMKYIDEKNLSKKLNELIGKKIYDIELRYLKKEIEKDPWIKFAQVSIEKPDSLIVKVMEFDPIYIWNNKFYIDKDGSTITIDKYYIKNILKLNSNISNQNEMYKAYMQIQNILSKINLKINEIDQDLETLKIVTNKYNFYVNFTIFERKLIEFVGIYDQFSSKSERLKKVKNIDLRYPTGFAVQ